MKNNLRSTNRQSKNLGQNMWGWNDLQFMETEGKRKDLESHAQAISKPVHKNKYEINKILD